MLFCAVSLPLSGLPTHCAVLARGLAWSRVVLPQPGAEAFICRSVWLSQQPSRREARGRPLTLRCSRQGDFVLVIWPGAAEKQWIMALGVGNPNAEARRMLDR